MKCNWFNLPFTCSYNVMKGGLIEWIDLFYGTTGEKIKRCLDSDVILSLFKLLLK